MTESQLSKLIDNLHPLQENCIGVSISQTWQNPFNKFLGSVNVDYTEDTYCIGNYPLSAALACTKVCSAFEEAWGVL